MKTASIFALLLIAGSASAQQCNVGCFSTPVLIRNNGYGHRGDYYDRYFKVDYTRNNNFTVGGGAISEDLLKYAFDQALKAKDDVAAAERRRGDEIKAFIASDPTAPPRLKTALAPPHAGLLVARNKCASCHTPSNSKGKGGGFAWLTEDGQLVNDIDTMKRIHEAIRTKKMGARDLPLLSDREIADMAFLLMETAPKETAKAAPMEPAR